MTDTEYSVYKHSFPNGKVYIGISNNPERRWDNGFGYTKNRKMFFDIVKYGWDNIDHQIIASGLSLSKAAEMEKSLISSFGVEARDRTYNTMYAERHGMEAAEIGEMPYLKAISNQSIINGFDDDWVEEYTPNGMYQSVKYGTSEVKLYTIETTDSGALCIAEQTFFLPFGTWYNEETTVNQVLNGLRSRSPKKRLLEPHDLSWLN